MNNILLIIKLIIDFFLIRKYRSNKDSDTECVRLPNLYFKIFIVFSILFMLPIYASMSDELYYHDPVYWFFLTFDILCVYSANSQLHWKIAPHESGFVYTTTFGRCHTFSYDSIQRIKTIKSGDIIIRIHQRFLPIIIDKHAVGVANFIHMYDRYVYRKRNVAQHADNSVIKQRNQKNRF